MRHKGRIIDRLQWRSPAGEVLDVPIRMDRDGTKVSFSAIHDESGCAATGPDIADVIKGVSEQIQKWYALVWTAFLRVTCKATGPDDRDAWSDSSPECSLSLEWDSVLVGVRDNGRVWVCLPQRNTDENGLWDGEQPTCGRWQSPHSGDPCEERRDRSAQTVLIPLTLANLQALTLFRDRLIDLATKLKALFTPEAIGQTMLTIQNLSLRLLPCDGVSPSEGAGVPVDDDDLDEALRNLGVSEELL
jgi:hypothetical protein